MENKTPGQQNLIEDLLTSRGNQYGLFQTQAVVVQRLKKVMHDCPNWKNLPDDMKEGLEMIQHKIGRILNGNPFYKDSWLDIEGYSRCVSRQLPEDSHATQPR